MTSARLTRHAEERLSERSKLDSDTLRRLLDGGTSITIALQKGGRYAKRLLYSSADKNWFIAVQDCNDGGVLTVLPFDFGKDRLSVRAAQKRSARKRNKVVGAASPILEPHPDSALTAVNSGWSIRVQFTVAGKPHVKTVARTAPKHGQPLDWANPGPVHSWFRERLLESAIPFRAVQHVSAHRKSEALCADSLLEHLPMTQKEIDECR